MRVCYMQAVYDFVIYLLLSAYLAFFPSRVLYYQFGF